jgi:hypothetical protein
MTIDQSNRSALQHVSCSTANASTSELHLLLVRRTLSEDALGARVARPDHAIFCSCAKVTFRVEEARSAWVWA